MIVAKKIFDEFLEDFFEIIPYYNTKYIFDLESIVLKHPQLTDYMKYTFVVMNVTLLHFPMEPTLFLQKVSDTLTKKGNFYSDPLDRFLHFNTIEHLSGYGITEQIIIFASKHLATLQSLDKLFKPSEEDWMESAKDFCAYMGIAYVHSMLENQAS